MIPIKIYVRKKSSPKRPIPLTSECQKSLNLERSVSPRSAVIKLNLIKTKDIVSTVRHVLKTSAEESD